MGAIANCLMRMKRTLSLLISLLFLSLWNVSAQYYVVGQDPASVRWKQINTPRFQIIYPGDFESNAQRLAAILEKTYLFAGKTLQHQPGKISVILHTETVRSNGESIGVICTDDKKLFEFLSNIDEVKKVIDYPRKKYTLSFNSDENL